MIRDAYKYLMKSHPVSHSQSSVLWVEIRTFSSLVIGRKGIFFSKLLNDDNNLCI